MKISHDTETASSISSSSSRQILTKPTCFGFRKPDCRLQVLRCVAHPVAFPIDRSLFFYQDFQCLSQKLFHVKLPLLESYFALGLSSTATSISDCGDIMIQIFPRMDHLLVAFFISCIRYKVCNQFINIPFISNISEGIISI